MDRAAPKFSITAQPCVLDVIAVHQTVMCVQTTDDERWKADNVWDNPCFFSICLLSEQLFNLFGHVKFLPSEELHVFVNLAVFNKGVFIFIIDFHFVGVIVSSEMSV